MNTPTFSFWSKWLVVAASALCAFGLFLVAAPFAGERLFSLLIYFSAERISAFPIEAVAYIRLAHTILGTVLLGWGITLLYIICVPFRRMDPIAWKITVISILAWFIPDTAYSVLSGFWPNAVLNVSIAVLFAIPLAFTRKAFKKPMPR